MQSILIILFCHKMSAGDVVIEMENHLIEQDIEEEYYKISEAALSCILQTKINKQGFIMDSDSVADSEAIIGFFELEIELLFMLLEYYELKCDHCDYEGNRIENLIDQGKQIRDHCKQYKKAFSKTFKKPKADLLGFQDTGPLLLTRY